MKIMENKLQIFKHSKFGEIRTMLNEKGEVFFVGKDVAKALGYRNPSNALLVHVDTDDKTTYPIQVSGSNYKTNTMFINESGLYSLILSSKLPSAKAFKRWVTAEVLPQINHTGGYIPTRDDEGHQLSDMEILAAAAPTATMTTRVTCTRVPIWYGRSAAETSSTVCVRRKRC